MSGNGKELPTMTRAAALVAVVGSACLTRPVVTSNPNLKTNFTTMIHNEAVEKVDLLFMIDNSASMGDKRRLLASAIPDMITRLVTPNCVDGAGEQIPGVVADQSGRCAQGKAWTSTCSSHRSPALVRAACRRARTTTVTLSTGAYTQLQIAGKAYPSAREMQIAHAMSANAAVGDQGIVSSLCPIHTHYVGGTTDPLYGYRPAVNAIVDRLKNALNVQCLPEKLTLQPDGTAPCLLLAQFPGQSGGSQYCATLGLQPPDEQTLKNFQQASDLNANVPVCVLHEIPSVASNADFQACSTSAQLPPTSQGGWCYVSGAAAGSRPQEILFTENQPPPGVLVSLQCIEQVNAVVDGRSM